MHYSKDSNYRKQQLKKLLHILENSEDEILDCLHADFKKPRFEGFLSETNYVIADLKQSIKKITGWVRPKMVLPSLLNFPSTDYIYKEPYGKVLIIAPWNYPFQLALSPAIAAYAAGNQVVIKPSELTPNTSAIIAKIINEVFSEEEITVAEGGVEIAQELLQKRWDYIFFTGSVAVGKMVAQAAVKNLTPFTLELGGKNPCIIDQFANLQLSAKRIVWGKFINAGQTCIAPDYLIVHEKIKQEFIALLKQELQLAYGTDPQLTPDFSRIVNKKHWERLSNYLVNQEVIFGGTTHEETLYIAPTLINEPKLDSPIMQEEIFGPLLPILSYQEFDDIDKIITRYEKPLALYVFSKDKPFAQKIIQHYSFGGGCINDTVVQFVNHRLPFGGVGHSGIGAYHGKFSFDTFSHQKAIVKKATWLDISLRYAPYNTKFVKFRKLLSKL